MKILVPGDQRRANRCKRFECEECGCVFIADKSEYMNRSNQREGPLYESVCPCCKRTVWNNSDQIIIAVED